MRKQKVSKGLKETSDTNETRKGRDLVKDILFDLLYLLNNCQHFLCDTEEDPIPDARILSNPVESCRVNFGVTAD